MVFLAGFFFLAFSVGFYFWCFYFLGLLFGFGVFLLFLEELAKF